ncbi:MAG: amino acid racemase [Thermoanaerobaculia bacterium]|nr:MAG: amino acid racemase [Thermoanaerobaculia bacterium]
MKTIGLIGGMSWESTAIYYRVINERVKQRLGGLHSAKIVLVSIDFAELAVLQREERWREAGEMMVGAARTLAAAGADLLVLTANTMHKVAPAVVDAVPLPLLHIVDVTATEIRAAGARTVGLLGTRFTMEDDFFRERLASPHGIRSIVPGAEDRDFVHRAIYDELCLGVVREPARLRFLEIVGRLAAQGAEGVILACTELSLILPPGSSSVALWDTATIHATAAADLALADDAGGVR